MQPEMSGAESPAIAIAEQAVPKGAEPHHKPLELGMLLTLQKTLIADGYGKKKVGVIREMLTIHSSFHTTKTSKS